MSKKQSSEMRILVIWLSVSWNRCSISSLVVVLLQGEKKRGRRRLGAIFKSYGKGLLKTVEVIVALSTFVELALKIMNWINW